MATVIDALIVTYALDPSGIEEGAKEATGALETMKANALSIFAAIGGIALFTGLMKSSFDAAIAAGVLADSLGEDVEQINAMGQAVAAQGGTVEGFNDSLGNLNSAVGEFAAGFGGPGADAFEKFGISMRDANGDMRKSSDVMLDLSDHLSKMTIGEAVAIGETMGIDAATIKSIHGGREATLELIKVQKEKGGMTDKDVEQAKKLQDSMKKTKADIERATIPILTMIMPALSMLAEVVAVVASAVGKGFKAIGDFVKDHGTVIVVALGVAATAFGVIYRNAVMTAAAAMIKFGMASLRAGAMFVLANLPLIAMVGIIALVSAAIGLLVEDFMVWMDGGESAIGSVLGDFDTFWAGIKPIFDSLAQIFTSVWDLLTTPAKIAFGILKGLFTGDFEFLKSTVLGLGDVFTNLWEGIKSLAQPFFDWISEKFSGMGEVVGGIAKFFGVGGDEEGAEVGAPGAKGAGAPTAKDAVSPSAIAAGAGAGNKTVTVTQSVGSVTVNTQATDGKGVASALNGATNTELQGLVNSVDSGVMQ
ncbi:hypothetical protein ACIQVE_21425 [Pseudomonas sp. NPDC098747]|uniref:hypothetical protein n=1 Tax=Pseudomonas sp. NPDC098747 TaxID=3364487 RepID=UPI00383A2671